MAKQSLFDHQGRTSNHQCCRQRNRNQHGHGLLRQLEGLHSRFEDARERQTEARLEEGLGLQIEFESFPDVELALDSLALEGSGIELLNARHTDTQTFATVFVPDGKLEQFEKRIKEYLDESKDGKDGPRNRKLLDTISQVRAATLKALWTDDHIQYPNNEDTELWWEIWVAVRIHEVHDNNKRSKAVNQFKQLAQRQGFRFANGHLNFPERIVLLAFGSVRQMKESIVVLNRIAELRQARETAEFFDSLPPLEQSEWLEDLRGRLTAPSVDAEVPHLCILDTGVNYGHPLLDLTLSQADLHTINPEWNGNDDAGHGTEMAGLATMGDLTSALSSQTSLEIPHRLESVQLLRGTCTKQGNPQLHGYRTIQAVARPEVAAPKRKRVFSMAITARDQRDRGRPSAWSATIDHLASDADSQGEAPRLFVISAGNANNSMARNHNQNDNSIDSIQDPGQSWNALTVGASTKLVQISGSRRESYDPVAPEGGLSPLTTTSQDWETKWPLKPDVVDEGGNRARNSLDQYTSPDLSLLTTHFKPQERLFTIATGTSAATALVARSAARLMAEYPRLWPQTIRALIVHSATWTEAMTKQFLSNKPKKSDYTQLIRHCGFGIPNLDQAMWSVQNSLTMVCEDNLQPFRQKQGSSDTVMNEMKIHKLPWPIAELQNLGAKQVEMRITLSYFIEPNPSTRPPKSRYRYESHGLRFDVRRPTESTEGFRQRINKAVREETDQEEAGESLDNAGMEQLQSLKTQLSLGASIGPDDPQRVSQASSRSNSSYSNWLIGINQRHKGSLHSDIWLGSAADLARCGVVGIYPVAGWWKTRKKLKRYNSLARYALVISIKSSDIEIDLYAAVASKIPTPIAI